MLKNASAVYTYAQFAKSAYENNSEKQMSLLAGRLGFNPTTKGRKAA